MSFGEVSKGVSIVDWYRNLEDHDRQTMTCLVDSNYMAALEFAAWCVEHGTPMFSVDVGRC